MVAAGRARRAPAATEGQAVKTSRLITVDIGNTTVALGLFVADRLAATARIPVGQGGDLARLWPDDFPPVTDLAGTPLVGCSVNPPALERVEAAVAALGARLLLVRRDLEITTAVRVREPQKVGADRLVNAYEAFARFRRAAVVVDFGTAITLDGVSADGAFLGGAIAPGVQTSMAALSARGAQLLTVHLVTPRHAVGRSTVEAMQSGAVYGFAGQVDRIVEEIAAELGGLAVVVATGGLASCIVQACRRIDRHDPWLTLRGLQLVWRRNT